MAVQDKVHQFTPTLHQILNSQAQTRVKIALLRSLKEELKLTLTMQLKIHAIEEATCQKEQQTTIAERHYLTVSNTNHPSYRNTSRMGITSYESQQRQRKVMMRAISHLFEQRANLSHCQLELQSIWDRNYQHYKKYIPEKRYQQQEEHFNNKKGTIINNLSVLLTKFTEVKNLVKVQFENYEDLIKILRVKYIRGKQKTSSSRPTKLHQSLKSKGGKQVLMAMRLLDENNNQILVNL